MDILFSLPKEIQFQHDSSDSILSSIFHVTFGLTTKKYEDMLKLTFDLVHFLEIKVAFSEYFVSRK